MRRDGRAEPTSEVANNAQHDPRRADAECEKQPSNAGIVCDVGRTKNNSCHGDGNSRPESFDELTLEESAEKEFLEQWCADATEQNEHCPSGGAQLCNCIQRVIRVAGRSEDVDEWHKDEGGEAARHDCPHETDDKINPAKSETEIAANSAGAVAVARDDARAEESGP